MGVLTTILSCWLDYIAKWGLLEEAITNYNETIKSYQEKSVNQIYWGIAILPFRQNIHYLTNGLQNIDISIWESVLVKKLIHDMKDVPHDKPDKLKSAVEHARKFHAEMLAGDLRNELESAILKFDSTIKLPIAINVSQDEGPSAQDVDLSVLSIKNEPTQNFTQKKLADQLIDEDSFEQEQIITTNDNLKQKEERTITKDFNQENQVEPLLNVWLKKKLIKDHLG